MVYPNTARLYWSRLFGKRFEKIKRAVRLFHLETISFDIYESDEALDLYTAERADETARWRRLAWRYGLSLPIEDDKEAWEKLNYRSPREDGSWTGLVFSKVQIARYRKAVREERLERANIAIKWITLIASIVAAISGVLVLIKQA